MTTTCRSDRVLRTAPAAVLVAAWIAVLPGGARAQSSVPVALLEPGHLLSVSEIVDADAWRDAERVLGGEGESRVEAPTETQYDLLHVPLVVAGRSLTIGDRLQTFRLDRRIHDPTTHEPLGHLLLPTGTGIVDSLGPETARLRVTDAFHPIVIGDYVRRVESAGGSASPATAPATSWGNIVAFQEEKAIQAPYDRMFLRPEPPNGLHAGQVVELYRPGEVRDGASLPDEEIGRALIVRVDGELAAAVLFELFRSDLAVGDRFRPPRNP